MSSGKNVNIRNFNDNYTSIGRDLINQSIMVKIIKVLEIIKCLEKFKNKYCIKEEKK